MHKILVIAVREYRAAVRTKAFVISLVLMPVLMGSSIGISALVQKLEDVKDKRFAIVDRTPGQTLFPALEGAAKVRNEHLIFDPETKKQIKSVFLLEPINPSADTPESINQQRFELSERVQKGEFFGFLEIGPNVYDFSTADPATESPLIAVSDRSTIRYQSSKPNYGDFFRWVDKVANAAIERKHFADNPALKKAGLDLTDIQHMQQPVPLRTKGLTKMDAAGHIVDASDESQIVNFLVPAALITLMFMMIMIGATPPMQGVVEEKILRIAEVLLGSVRPFELMLGKLLGMIAVSLTAAAIYLGGSFYLAHRYGYTEYVRPDLLAWFLVYMVLALLMYGSMFIAIGASATDMKEAQALLMPVTMIAVLPMVVLMAPIIQDPRSPMATAASFIPPWTPMLMMARQAVPPGVPLWQPILGMAGVIGMSLACVYAAGRIFRVGLLMQGKGAKWSDLARWVFRG